MVIIVRGLIRLNAAFGIVEKNTSFMLQEIIHGNNRSLGTRGRGGGADLRLNY